MAIEKPAATAEYRKNLRPTTFSASVASAAKAKAAKPRTSTNVRNRTFLFMQKALLVCNYFYGLLPKTTFFPTLLLSPRP
jgi:hypothetical protein